MTTTAAERIAAPARLDCYREATTAPDAPLDAFLSFLRELAKADLSTLAPDITDPDKARAVALGHLQGAVHAVVLHLCSRYPDVVRSAAAAALAELVTDSLRDCPGVGCGQSVAPWDGSTCGDPLCEAQYARSVGEA